MTAQLLITLVAASVGLVSGGWLCYPTAMERPDALAWKINPPYKFTKGLELLVIAQTAQYIVGGMLLCVAFLLQIAAVLIPSAIEIPIPQFLQNQFLLHLAVLIPSLALTYRLSRRLFFARYKVLKRQVRQQQKHLAKYPRIRPFRRDFKQSPFDWIFGNTERDTRQ